MEEVHAPMTGLETCFEDELSSVPGWQKDVVKTKTAQETKRPKQTKDTDEAKKIEEVMVLGM